MSGVDKSLLWDSADIGVSGLSHGGEGECSGGVWEGVIPTIVCSSVAWDGAGGNIDEVCRNHFLLIVTIDGEKYMVSSCPG